LIDRIPWKGMGGGGEVVVMERWRKTRGEGSGGRGRGAERGGGVLHDGGALEGVQEP